MIAAIAENGVIGSDGGLPWRLPADFRHFKSLTMGHHLLMGRRTWESIGRPLPGRTTVVVSRRKIELPAGVLLADSAERGVEIAREAGDDEAFVAGGAEIYRRLLHRADRLYLTRVHAVVSGDTLFPHVPPAEWRLVASEERPADEKNRHSVTFQTYERRRGAKES